MNLANRKIRAVATERWAAVSVADDSRAMRDLAKEISVPQYKLTQRHVSIRLDTFLRAGVYHQAAWHGLRNRISKSEWLIHSSDVAAVDHFVAKAARISNDSADESKSRAREHLVA